MFERLFTRRIKGKKVTVSVRYVNDYGTDSTQSIESRLASIFALPMNTVHLSNVHLGNGLSGSHVKFSSPPQATAASLDLKGREKLNLNRPP